jgi:hypothetical protein
MFDIDGQPLFHLEGEVAIGRYETAKIISIDWEEKSLIVERGYIREASPHQKGEKVASHIRFWPGSWVMNVTDQCPKRLVHGVDYPVNYIEYYFALITGQTKDIYPNPWDNYDRITNIHLYDGIVIDRFEDKESWLKWVNDENEIYLDLYQNNSYVSSTEFDTSWENGTTQLFELLHTAYPDVVIIRNNPLTLRRSPFHGQVYESFGWSNPTQEWWKDLVIQHDPNEYYLGFAYLEWWTQQNKEKESSTNSFSTEPLILFEVYEDEGSPDEYDNSGEGKGYLGYPQDNATRLSSGVFKRHYQHGLVLVNPTDNPISVALDSTYKKIKGTQVPEINSSEIVNTVTIGAFDGIILLRIEP